MKKSDSGIIAILASYGTLEMRKVLDLKITSGFPTVTIPQNFKIRIPQHKLEIEGYQHITIPPDLKVHITGDGKPKIWGDEIKNLLTISGKLTVDYQKILTVIFPPINDFPIFTDRSYNGANIIGFSQLPHWNQYTSFVLELFAQNNEAMNIPNDSHYLGDQGAYMPWGYSSIGRTYNEPYKKGDFFVRQFAITNHDKKQNKIITIYFGDFDKHKMEEVKK